MAENKKEIFIQKPGSSFELEEDEGEKVDTDVDVDVNVEETQHNVASEIISARKAKKLSKEQEEAWEFKRKLQEEEALAIEELQKALEADPLVGVTQKQLDYEDSIDQKFSPQSPLAEKKPPAAPLTLWQRIKKLF